MAINPLSSDHYQRFFEMADSRRRIADKTSNISYPVTMHLLKLMFAGKTNQNINHWKQEIYAFLNYCHVKIKVSNKYPEKEFYYEFLWGHMDEDEASRKIINTIDATFENNPNGVNISNINEKFKLFFLAISQQLSESEFSRQIVYKTIDDLILN